MAVAVTVAASVVVDAVANGYDRADAIKGVVIGLRTWLGKETTPNIAYRWRALTGPDGLWLSLVGSGGRWRALIGPAEVNRRGCECGRESAPEPEPGRASDRIGR